jgi:virginiamycin B lyase
VELLVSLMLKLAKGPRVANTDDVVVRLDHNTGNITKFSTSAASPRIFGGNSTSETAYTLPYWIKINNNNAAEGSLWFNEHAGNKIARFIPSNMTLIEYWIPTQDRQWGSISSSDNF